MVPGGSAAKSVREQHADAVERQARELLGRCDPPPHHSPKAKRAIHITLCGGLSQVDSFDYKPALAEKRGQDLPASVHMGQRLTTMTSGQSSGLSEA